MDNKETKLRVTELLNSGSSRKEVFQTLSGGAVNVKQLALFIASYADPYQCEQHIRKINILITVMFMHALFTALLGFIVGAQFGPVGSWVAAGFGALIPLLFAYGFYKNHAGTYNTYILLGVILLPQAFVGISHSPIASGIGISINIATLAYVWYVRSLLFPDFAFITPKKIKGQYVFSS